MITALLIVLICSKEQDNRRRPIQTEQNVHTGQRVLHFALFRSIPLPGKRGKRNCAVRFAIWNLIIKKIKRKWTLCLGLSMTGLILRWILSGKAIHFECDNGDLGTAWIKGWEIICSIKNQLIFHSLSFFFQYIFLSMCDKKDFHLQTTTTT